MQLSISIKLRQLTKTLKMQPYTINLRIKCALIFNEYEEGEERGSLECCTSDNSLNFSFSPRDYNNICIQGEISCMDRCIG